MKKFFGVILRAIVFYDYVILHFDLKNLKKKVDKGNHIRECGICSNLSILPLHIKPSLWTLFSRWPKYSGCREFPVPHQYLHPARAYSSTIDLWVGDYGKDRIELLDHMIEDSKNIILIGFNWKNGEK